MHLNHLKIESSAFNPKSIFSVNKISVERALIVIGTSSKCFSTSTKVVLQLKF